MDRIISLLVIIGIGLLCSYIHKSKGYSPVAGFFLGFLLPLVGIIIVLTENNKQE